MSNNRIVDEEYFNENIFINGQLNTLYLEVNKLAIKKPTERLTGLISKKINHIIKKVKELISNDEFLDAIETVPTEGDFIRYDEALITLSEMKRMLHNQFNTPEFLEYIDSRKKQKLLDLDLPGF